MKLSEARRHKEILLREIDTLFHYYPPHPNRKNTPENVKESLTRFLDGATVADCAKLHKSTPPPGRGGMDLILKNAVRKILAGPPKLGPRWDDIPLSRQREMNKAAITPAP